MADNFKPTNKDPISDQSRNFEKNFKNIMNVNNVKLNEVDGLLTEKEQSLKKKIFSLSKMESLVFSDPKLTAIYDDMAEDGEEKYGYHYNETIMNMIFNEYVLNSPKYLQKYKMAIPKKKKRRDKSGINQLRKDAGLEPKKSVDENIDDMTKVQFLVNDNDPSNNDVFAYFPEENHDVGGKFKMSYSHIGQHSACHPEYARESRPATTEEYGELKNELETLGYKLDIMKEAFSKSGKPTATNPQVTGGKIIDTGKGDGVSETSTTGSVGGAGMGSGGYATPRAWSSSGDLTGGGKPKRKPIWKGGTIIQETNYLTDPSGFEKYFNALNENSNISEHHLETREEKSEFIFNYLNSLKDGNVYDSEILDKLSDDEINQLYMDVEEDMGISEEGLEEKAVSKAQQRFMGMVRGVQTGDVNPSDVSKNVLKTAATMKKGDVKDFASTKHDDLPEKMDEHHLNTREDKCAFIKKAFYKLTSDTTPNPEREKIQKEFLDSLSDVDIDGIYVDYENRLEEIGIDPKTIKETDQSMIDANAQTMANKPAPVGDLGSNVDMGARSMAESKELDVMKKSQKLLEELNNELDAFSIHHNKLKKMAEDRRPSSLILKDRLGSDNEKNFKKDLQHSGTKEIIDAEKELQWKDQQTEVGDKPQKLGQDIEKQVIKTTKGNALENVGDSANQKGDEVPKRNLTTDEQDEVDMYRLGQQDLVYDNKPNERFEERMKADMGDKLYDQRQKKLEFRGKAPMYNKDPQPVEDTTSDKVQFNKEQTGWNEREGLKESMITGRYKDILGKRRLIDFTLDEITLTESIDENHFPLDFTGLGNAYISRTTNYKVSVNETVTSALDSHKFFTDGKKVFATKNPVQKLNENEQKEEKPVVNEHIDKMKHLLGYKPNEFVNTKNVKKNRGF